MTESGEALERFDQAHQDLLERLHDLETAYYELDPELGLTVARYRVCLLYSGNRFDDALNAWAGLPESVPTPSGRAGGS